MASNSNARLPFLRRPMELFDRRAARNNLSTTFVRLEFRPFYVTIRHRKTSFLFSEWSSGCFLRFDWTRIWSIVEIRMYQSLHVGIGMLPTRSCTGRTNSPSKSSSGSGHRHLCSHEEEQSASENPFVTATTTRRGSVAILSLLDVDIQTSQESGESLRQQSSSHRLYPLVDFQVIPSEEECEVLRSCCSDRSHVRRHRRATHGTFDSFISKKNPSASIVRLRLWHAVVLQWSSHWSDGMFPLSQALLEVHSDWQLLFQLSLLHATVSTDGIVGTKIISSFLCIESRL